MRLPPAVQSSTHDPSPMNQDDGIERNWLIRKTALV